MNVTDDRQTTDGRAIAYSERERFIKRVKILLSRVSNSAEVLHSYTKNPV